jgi:hypothetical protein
MTPFLEGLDTQTLLQMLCRDLGEIGQLSGAFCAAARCSAQHGVSRLLDLTMKLDDRIIAE